MLHRAAYAALGLDWTYDAHEVAEDGLPAFLAGLDDSLARAVADHAAQADRRCRCSTSVTDARPAGRRARTPLRARRTARRAGRQHRRARARSPPLRERYDGPVDRAVVLGGGATAASTGAGAGRPRLPRTRHAAGPRRRRGPPRRSAAVAPPPARPARSRSRSLGGGAGRPADVRGLHDPGRGAGRRAAGPLRRACRWSSTWSTTRGRRRWRPPRRRRAGARRRARPARAPGGAPGRADDRPPPAAARGDARGRRARRSAARGSTAGPRRGAPRPAAASLGSPRDLVPRTALAAGAPGWPPARRAAVGAGCPSRRRSRPEPAAGARPRPTELAGVDEPKEPYADVAALPGLALEARARLGGRRRRWSARGSAGRWPLLFLLYLVPVGVALAVVDWRTRLLPTAADRAVVRRGRRCSRCWPRLLDRGLARRWCARRSAGVAPFAVFFAAVVRLPARAWATATSGSPGCSACALGWLGWGQLRRRASTPASCSAGCRRAAARVLRVTSTARHYPFGPFMLRRRARSGVLAAGRAGWSSGSSRVGGGRAEAAADARERLAAMLRWLTAGESHGPALVADPRGAARPRPGDHRRHRRRAGPPPARLRPRRPDEVRAGRGRRSSAASGTARPSAARSRSGSATPSGPSGRR